MNRYLAYSVIFIIVFLAIKGQFIDPPPKEGFSNAPNKTHLYVTTDSIAVHVGAEPNSGVIDSHIYYRNRIKIHSRKDGWVRYTEFIDGKVLGLQDSVAYWLDESFLNATQPPEVDTINN